MSKVYEALRQKERETSASPQGVSSAVADSPAGATVAVSQTSEAVLTDRVLRSVFAAGDEQRPYRESVVQGISSSHLPGKSPSAANEFRRLKLSCGEDSRLVFKTDPHGLATEQFRLLRRNLEQKFPAGGVILITSPAPRDGKTLTTLNLSACLADSGRSTLLLEGDIRQPGLHRFFGETPAAPGIEDALAGSVEPSAAIHLISDFGLHVAMVAAPPADPSRLVSSSGAKQFVEWARERFDWVIIDSPPVLPAADVAQLMPLADAVLLVIRTNGTPRDLAKRAFELVGDRLSGVILNEASVESNPYYRYLADYRQKDQAPQRATPNQTNGHAH